MATREELAWAAGFFDGEGSVGGYTGARTKTGIERRYLRISVAQKNRPLLDKFADIFRCGSVHCDRKRAMHSFQASGRTALTVIDLMWPWLGEQKKRDLKRGLRLILDTRVAADAALAPKERTCIAPDCDRIFTPDVRHPNSPYCSNRCYQRVFARIKRGPAPPKHCSGCGCPVDQRMRGCRRCMTRHWQRKNKAAQRG